MAWTDTDRSATRRALIAAGKPVLIAGSWVDAADAPHWSADGTWGGTDTTDAGGPGDRVVDGWAHLSSYPTGTGTDLYLVGKITERSHPVLGFDCAVICGLPEFTAPGVGIKLQISDDSGFTTRVATIATWNPVTRTPRLFALDLKQIGDTYAQVYAGVAYWRIHFEAVSGVIVPRPALTEVFLGAATVLERKPMIPWSSRALATDKTDHPAKSGVATEYVRSAGARRIRARFAPDSTADVAAIRWWWTEDTAHGQRKTWWVERPGDTGRRGLPALCRAPAALSLELQGPFEHAWDLELDEIAPFLEDEHVSSESYGP